MARRFHIRRSIRAAALLLLVAPALAALSSRAQPICAPSTESAAAPLPRTLAALERGALTILALGSSSTTGYGVGGAADAYPARLAEAPVWNGAVTVVARGRNGENAAGAVKRMAAEIDAAAPDLLVWQVGTNDALALMETDRFAHLLDQGLALARERGVDAVLIDPQFFPDVADDPGYAAFADRVAEAGGRWSAPVVSRFRRMRDAYVADPAGFDAWLAADRFHMSAMAHACLATELAATVIAGAATAR